MARGPKYRHESRKYIVLALATMIENLDKKLKITDSVTGQLDTLEEHRKMDKDLERDSSEEELERGLDESRDRSIAEIGHIQRRIEDVKQLKAAFESHRSPPDEVIKKTCDALKDSIVFEAIKLYGLLLKPDKSTWGAERLAEDEREKYSTHIYAQALMLGFGVWPQMRWHSFPFDDH